jgi:hypothetical protein
MNARHIGQAPRNSSHPPSKDFSYGAQFHSAPSPTAPSFIWRLLRIRLEEQEGAE